MKRLNLVPIYLIAFFFMYQSCAKEALPDKKKITYRVQGEAFSVTFTRSDGVNETYYNQSGVFKQDVFANVGEPVLLLARGSDDINIRIIFEHGIDTVRTAKESGSSLVFIQTSIPELP